MSTSEAEPSATGEFEIVRRAAPAGLEGLVIETIGYRERAGRPIRQIEAASLTIPLIVSFGEPFEIALSREPSPDERFGSFTAGLCAGPAIINSQGAAHCMQVNFTPLGACRFFGLPMRELADRMVALDDLGDGQLHALRQRLGEEDRWDARFALFEGFIRARLLRGRPVSRAAAWAYGQIVATDGRMSVARLAERLDWSRKHLAARFNEEIGLPPKAVARIARFTRARELAAARTEAGWADIAAACGYADQAHLAREFREFSGATPSAWLAQAAN